MSTALNIKPRIKMSKSLQAAKNEDAQILRFLEKTISEIDDAHNRFDNITDPILIDSCIYEMQSLNMKYMYYLRQCKERGMAAVTPVNTF